MSSATQFPKIFRRLVIINLSFAISVPGDFAFCQRDGAACDPDALASLNGELLEDTGDPGASFQVLKAKLTLHSTTNCLGTWIPP